MRNKIRYLAGLFLLISLPALAAPPDDMYEKVHALYTAIHEFPELGNEEFETQKRVTAALKSIGFTHFIPSKLAPTAVITVLDSGKPGPTIALRADMDARATQEPKTHQPRSHRDGLMHNCGHDAHSAMLFGAAYYLKNNLDSFAGKIVFLFQPAEETKGGADSIVEEEILETLGVSAIFAQHVYSGLPVGTLSLSAGASLAGSNYFKMTIRGQGSHAALPSGGSDTLVTAAKILTEFAQMPARNFDVVDRPMIISPTQINANSSSLNIVPSEVVVQGTIRAFEDLFDNRKPEQNLHDFMQFRVKKLGEAYGVDIELTIHRGSPPTVNDKTLYAKSVSALQKNWPGKIKLDLAKGMFSEDFAFYTERTPALYLGLGIAKDGLGEAGAHTQQFTIHPDALPYGVQALVSLAQLHTLGMIYSW